MDYRCFKITLRVKHVYTNRERWEVLRGYLSLGRRLGRNWANTLQWTNVLQSSFQTVSSRITSKFSSLSHSSRRPNKGKNNVQRVKWVSYIHVGRIKSRRKINVYKGKYLGINIRNVKQLRILLIYGN